MAAMTTKKSNTFSKTAIRIAIGIAVLAGLVAGGYFAYTRYFSSQTTATEESPLQTAKATKGDLVLYADGTGTIIAQEESAIGFNTSGPVKAIGVKVGDTVQKGQVLAQLDDTAAQAKLIEAQEAMNTLTSAAAIATAKQTLATAESDFAAARKSLSYLISPEVLYWEEKIAERQQTLTDAQTAYQTDTSDAAKQKVTDAETSLTYAQNELKYFQTVYEETYISKNFTQYTTRRTRRGTVSEVTKVEDETTGKMVDLIIPPSEGEIGMARAKYDLAKAAIGEAQTYLDVLNGGEIPAGATGSNLLTYIETQHALETAQYNLEATRLVALFNGTVTTLDMSVGDMVNGNSVMTISNLDQPYSLDAYLDAEDWGEIQEGYGVDVSFDILPDLVFTGVVTNVYPTLDNSSANKALVHITARLNDTMSYNLPAGAAASVDVIGGRAQNAVLVPVEALHEIGEGQYTLFVMQDGKLRLHEVQVGLQDLTKAEIISGVNAGDIVTTGRVETK
jgi:multidrug efflux pump subunit AcrA (membrane-fusion protein)